MKKSSFSIMGMMAMVLALFFIFISCDNGTGDLQKSIKITGINQQNIKASAQIDVNAGDMSNSNGQGSVSAGRGTIVNQTLLVDLYSWKDGINGEWSENPWTGNGQWCIRLMLRHSDDNHQYDYVWKDWQKYDINDVVTELNFADFVLVYEEGK